MKTIFTSLAMSLVLLASSVSFAADPLESKLSVYVVDQQSGKEKLLDQEKVEPGQTLEYRLAYTNTTESPLRITAASGLIPENTSYVAKSESASVNATFEASIDNGQSFELEPIVRTRVVDGKKEKYTVPVSAYTNVRWTKPEAIGAGKTQTYIYRVTVN